MATAINSFMTTTAQPVLRANCESVGVRLQSNLILLKQELLAHTSIGVEGDLMGENGIFRPSQSTWRLAALTLCPFSDNLTASPALAAMLTNASSEN